MSSQSTFFYLEDYFHRLTEYGTTHARHQQLLDEIWGKPQPCSKSPEENASLISQYLYSWIYPYTVKAAQESLTVSQLPQCREVLLTQYCGRKLSKALQRKVYDCNAWKCMLGCQVFSKEDIKSKGILRWIGIPQQGKYSRILAGVEWIIAPKIYESARDDATANSHFFDGVAFGEHLFDPEQLGMSTLEDPSSLEITVACNASMPAPPPPKRIPLFWTILCTLPGYTLQHMPFVFLSMLANLSGPLLLKAYVGFLDKKEYNPWEGVLIVAALSFTYAINPILRNRGFFLSMCAGAQFRTALSSIIFEKCMTMSNKSIATPSMNAGRIVNMISTDVERTVGLFSNLDTIWSSPLQLVISIFILYNMVGWCSFVGLLIFATSIPLNTYLMSILVKARRTLSSLTDARVRGINEFISGVRVAKFMTWEPRFINEIEKKRDAELRQLRKIQLCRVLMSFLNAAIPNAMIATVFAMYYLLGNEITATVVFPTISLFGLITGPFMEIPMTISLIIQFKIALERLKRFFECENTPQTAVADIEQLLNSTAREKGVTNPAVLIEDADFLAYIPRRIPKVPSVSTSLKNRVLRFFLHCRGWRPPRERPPLVAKFDDETSEVQTPASSGTKEMRKHSGADSEEFFEVDRKVLLRNVSLEFPRGKLTVIIGRTGCGKSTLMQSLLSQLEVSKGRVWTTKSIAYVPQQPWIMNATVRQNVLFFSEDLDDKLQEAIHVSQLQSDLEVMVSGLETEIGEKGINLSGGQKARVSLARAVYADREMYLLDDPLSALDAHVGERVLKDCILGKLAGKTRVLATHHLHVLDHADHVIVLSDERVAFEGDRASFLNSAVYRSLDLSSDEKKDKAEYKRGSSRESIPMDDNGTDNDTQKDAGRGPAEEEGEALEKKSRRKGKLMTEEEKAVGSVPLSTYKRFINYCGGMTVVSFILSIFAVTEILSMSSMVWLSLWTADSFHLSMSTYLTWYLILVFVGQVASPFRMLYSYSSMRRGSVELHKAVLQSVGSATLGFFDTTPVGRILQRFSRDIDVLDNTLPMALTGVVEMSIGIASSLLISIISVPLFAITLIPCGYFYYRIVGFYGTASREVRRLTSVVKSPVYSLLGEVTTGMPTIEAFGASPRFMAEAARRLDTVTSCQIFAVLIHRWLGIRVQLVNALVITFIAGVGMLSARHNGSDTALISLSLTMTMRTTSNVLRLLRQSVNVETEMNSVERLIHYTEAIPHEAASELQREMDSLREDTLLKGPVMDTVVVEPGDARVVAGSLEFRNVQLRYRENLPLVLKGVSFRIAPREKVGIVGRTGSGKSTLMLTFMRMVDICGGEILVNNSSIQSYPLRELRRKFSMIPQDPVLFEGTVRQNMDPFEEATDDELWEALQLCGLKERISAEEAGLAARVLEGGSNFSVGQRQLLCMSRALVRKCSGFLLMDEATANIDHNLDRAIQSTVMNAFAEYTVITIAHRLHTVANYDKIIVMDQGVVAETGTPRELVSNRQSIFRGMVAAMGDAAMNEFMYLLR